MSKYYLLLIIWITMSVGAAAQDLLFSQFYSAPLHLNPALSGGFGAKYRVSAIYRDQWKGPLEKSIGSFGGSIDLRFELPNGILAGDAVGVGLQFVTDQAGSVDLSTNTISISAAFHKSLSRNQKKALSGGIQLITGQRNILYEDLVFQDQFDGIDAFTGVTGEDLPSNNFGFSDLSGGLNFVSAENNDLQLFLGAAVHHILEPQYSFYKKDDDERQRAKSDSRLKRKYLFHAGTMLKAGENLRLSPRILFVAQGPSMRGHIGTNFIIEPNKTDAVHFHLGSWLALVRDFDGAPKPEALGIMVGLGLSDLLIGMSYDFNLRDLVNYRTGQGAFELSISYLGNYEDEGGLCPTF